jgi:uncharacterized damage-inducible protein DinB
MPDSRILLRSIFEGWEGYQTSILHAVAPLTRQQLDFRPAPQLRSVGETVGHIALGRIGWFARMHAPGSEALQQQAADIEQPGGNIDPAFAGDVSLLVHWLGLTWGMIADTLDLWDVKDLFRTYEHVYWGKRYAVSYQWTLWRILSHDIQHGGQIALMLGMQGIEAVELGDLGGHLTEPPEVREK